MIRTIQPTPYSLAQGPLLRRDGDRATVDAGGRVVTGRIIKQARPAFAAATTER